MPKGVKATVVTRYCEWCKTAFNIKSSKRNQFCSRSCAVKKTNTGRVHSEEVNKKKGRKGELNGFYGRRHTEKTKQTIGNKNRGTYEEKYGPEKALELKANLSDARKGENNHFYGKKHTPESRTKISQNHADVSGSKNPMYGKGFKILGEKNGSWKGGITFQERPREWSKELKTEIRKRDKFTCALCKKNGYDVHHIDYNKFNNTERNLITLCRSCHAKTNFNRNIWENLFKILILELYEK